MDTIVIEPPCTGRQRPSVLGLRPGASATFGRGAPDVPVDVLLPYDGISRLAGTVAAQDDFWTLSNLSRRSTYVVENLEGAGEHVKVVPGRLRAPIPFELSRLVLPARGLNCALKVYAPQHAFAAPAPPALGEPTTLLYALDPQTKYFRVLVALCEHRLRDPACVRIPTTAQVVARLRELDGCAGISARAVDYHIDYLVDTKLRLRDPAGQEPGDRMERKKELLVAFTLRFDLVREEHLALLARPRR